MGRLRERSEGAKFCGSGQIYPKIGGGFGVFRGDSQKPKMWRRTGEDQKSWKSETECVTKKLRVVDKWGENGIRIKGGE